ncbi:MAG: hypothetical protein WC490_06560 [Candidatus Margulisiibacteriota bacterium]
MVSSTELLLIKYGVTGPSGTINYTNPRFKKIDANHNDQISTEEAWKYLYDNARSFSPSMPPVINTLLSELRSGDAGTRINAAVRLGRMGATGAIPSTLAARVKSELTAIINKMNRTGAYCEPAVLRAAALVALGKIGGADTCSKIIEVLTKRWGPLAVNESVLVMREAIRMIGVMTLNGSMPYTKAEEALSFIRNQYGVKVDWPKDLRTFASTTLVNLRAEKGYYRLPDQTYQYREGFLWHRKASRTVSMDPSNVKDELYGIEMYYDEQIQDYVPKVFHTHEKISLQPLTDDEVMKIQAALFLVGRISAEQMKVYANRNACSAAVRILQMDHGISGGDGGNRFGVGTLGALKEEAAKFAGR